MYLKALEIQGFKSFPDKTRITFNTGITAIVGPNGSGKSNISDALRWVLGETSAKQLRGGGKMENVIFGGTSKRNAMGYAAVALVLDNTDRRVEVNADEVTIGRKYYRSGESEYSINGQSVRLRDVYELLLDTGLGRDGYSIIGQGRIDDIVSAKSLERREIFEEASGIARYRYRKNEAERRLASAEDNLVRLRDILSELEARVGPLEKESAKAKKFIEYAGDKKSLEVTLWVDTLRTANEALRTHSRKKETAEADYAAKRREIETIDDETEEIRAQINRYTVDIEREQNNIHEMQSELQNDGTKVEVLRSNIQRDEEDIEGIYAEIEKSGESAEGIAAEIKLQQDDIARAEAALLAVKDKITLLEKELSDIQEKGLASGERKGAVQAALASATERINKLRVQEASEKSAAEAASTRLEKENAEMLLAQTNIERLGAQKTDTESFLKTCTDAQNKLENMCEGLRIKLQTRENAYVAASTAEREAIRESENAAHRLQVLSELERSLDGFASSVKVVVKAGREGKLRGIIGPVSTILAVAPSYETAIEQALGFNMQNVVVTDEAAAKAAIAFLKETGGGRATFLPLDTVKPQYMDTSALPVGAQSAKTLVNYDAKYENIAASLLARIVVVEDLNEASRTAKHLQYKNRIVTRDGQIINAGGSFTGGSVSRSAGLFSRKLEMDELKNKLQTLKANCEKAKEKAQYEKEQLDAVTAELTATSSEAVTAAADKIRCEEELKRIEQSLAVAEGTKKRITGECELAMQQLTQANAQGEVLLAEQSRISVEIEHLSEELAAITGDDGSFLAQRQHISEELGELRMQGLTHENAAQLHRQRIETLTGQTGESAARRQAMQANIERLRAQINERKIQIETIETGKTDSAKIIKQKEEEIQAMRQKRMESEAGITGQTTRQRAAYEEMEALGREIGRLEEQKSAFDEQVERTVGQLWEEYELTPNEAQGLCVQFTSVTDLNRRVRELRGKIRALGDVYVGAIEEYEEVSTRYNELSSQVKDVQDSKNSLEKLIAELSAEMTELFAKSFADINRNFGRIFAELFGGGSANLSLTNPQDLLESGIDIEVAPPGKIIKDLTALSGGEQVLVAISIYFAILAVNPAPFCVLDEIEAALDDANIGRFAKYLRRITNRSQFIVITHRRGTMEEADVLYGVTMQEDGVSKLLKLNVADVDASLVR